MIKIYTDGATSNNGKENARGGWAFAVVNNNNEIVSSHYGPITGDKITNNVAELLAVIMGLRAVMGSFPELTRANEPIEIYSDSAYFCNCIKDKWYVNWQNNGWLNAKKQPVENKELWEEIINLMNYANVSVNKVKGHSNNGINNYVDGLAKKAAKGETNYEV